MANKQHLALLKKGVTAWNVWRAQKPGIRPDLKGSDLSRLNLSQADLSSANLTYSHLTDANLSKAKLAHAKLVETNFVRTDLREADLTGVVVNGANFRDANLHGAVLVSADLGAASFLTTDLSNANLAHADLSYVRFVGTNLDGADLTGCRIYGISAWNLRLNGAAQENLIITPRDEPVITVDNVEVAQFVYLLLNNESIRQVIDTITAKVVLILGRFTAERKPILDALRGALRTHNYLPILFDFEKPMSRDLTETIATLAHMARFVIADITDAKSIPQELDRIIPGLPSVPVQPLMESSAGEYSMFEHFRRFPWVLPVYRYETIDGLVTALEEKVIAPAEAKAHQQRPDRLS